MSVLLPYQTAHAARIEAALRQWGVALDASDPGTGKTYVACAVAARLQCPVAVITTKATVPNWKAVAQAFGLSPVLVSNYEKVRTGRLAECRKSARRFVWNLPDGCLVIFDECQRCKGRTSLNAKLLIAARSQHLRVLLCSATAADSPLGMRAIGYALGLHTLANFWQWTQRHGVVAGVFGMEYKGGEACLRELHRQVFPAKGSRLRIEDIPDFPDTLIESSVIDTGKARAIQKEYDVLSRQLCQASHKHDQLKLKELAGMMEAKSPSAMTILLRARQAIERYKVAAMAELAEDALAEKMSVVLMVNFSETIHELSMRLSCPHLLAGGQSETERQDIIQRFQRNEISLLIANIKAGGVGVSLHDPQGIRPRLSLISPTFSADDLRQALGRVHRCGGAGSIQKICFAAGTCEERAAAACATKLNRISLLNDGDLFPLTFPSS